MTSRRPSRLPQRLTLAAALSCAVAVAGCSSDGGGDWLAMLQAARNTWETRDAPVGLNEAAAIPYATLGVRLDGGREQILVLATDAGGERIWTAGTAVAITTRHGRIIRTAGFGTDLSGYDGRKGESDWLNAHTLNWTADFADLNRYSVPVTCDSQPAGPDPITILGKQFDTVRVDLTCRSDLLDWSFVNSYWVSAQTGRVWRSREQFHPKGPVLDTELLRPPLSAD
jgi:hypothetical protein